VSDDNDASLTALEGGYAAMLPAEVQKGEVVVSVQPEGVFVGGEPEAVENYLTRIQEAAGHAVGVVGIDKASVGQPHVDVAQT
jgi:carbamoylphosphate synthase small subunit